MIKLKDRYDQYSEFANSKILAKVPIIVQINGKNFHNTTSLLDKPFDQNFSDCLEYTMKKLCLEVEGASIGYCYNDSIILILRNDQSINTIPWFNNNLQKLNSIISSITTSSFSRYSNNIGLQLISDPYFYCKIFPVPNLNEALNMLIFYQQFNILNSLNLTCYYSMLNKFNKSEIKETIKNMPQMDKIDFLESQYNIIFNDLPKKFRFGSLCLKEFKENKIQWEIITSPIISKDQELIKGYL